MNKSKKVIVTFILSIMLIAGSGIVVMAGSTGTEYVTKSSLTGTAYSNVSGGTMGQAYFTAACTKGTISVSPQERRAGKYQDVSVFLVSSGEQMSSNTSLTGAALWKLKLSGIGLGYGSITAR